MRSILICILALTCFRLLYAQPETYTRADSLRGFLFPERKCYDVTFYSLDLKIDPDKQTISGSNGITFKVVEDFDSMQIDLFANLHIEKITSPNGKKLRYSRELNAVFVKFSHRMHRGETSNIRVYYSGKPKVSQNPPWDDGFVWRRDTTGNYWIGVTCQGGGASVWWPNKDHQSDEPDSMLISITVPSGYMDVSNGRLRNVEKYDNWTKFTWFVSYPINNYCVTVNIGKYEHLSDKYIREGDTLDLDYYVIPPNEEKAEEHFQQVKPMMQCYEKLFGRYPFERDGYKLVETSYAGMEHQSAISYGNRYANGYYRRSASPEHGMKFDYIIIHESAHEWWGNSITTNDIADLWVHEGFAAYSEMLYLECMYDYQTSLEYINAFKKFSGNKKPIIGPYGVNKSGSDVYYKTALVLNTLRSVINDDKLWFDIIHGIQDVFKYKTIDGEDVIEYIKKRAGIDLDYFFDQYFRHPNLPVLELELSLTTEATVLRYRWSADVEEFRMPINVMTAPGKYERIYPTRNWQVMTISVSPEEFKVDENRFLVTIKMN